MSKKILVIDDEPDIVKVVAATLRTGPYEVITAGDGEEGFRKLQAEKPDLVILDILMPKMDGYTFVKKLKMAEAFRKIPVIVLTAKDKMKDLFSIEGVHEYLVKPFDQKDLLEKVKKHLE